MMLCRASLAEGAAPSLAAEGAALAAAFLDRGLDGGDGAVLQRMMGLLAAPLAKEGAGEQVGMGRDVTPCPSCHANSVLFPSAHLLIGLPLVPARFSTP
jgi:hypothetical protein